MNAIVNKLLLAGDKVISEIYLTQQGVTCSACGPFTKNKVIIKKLEEAGNSRYICQNDIDKACFQDGMADQDFKGVNRTTADDNVLRV